MVIRLLYMLEELVLNVKSLLPGVSLTFGLAVVATIIERSIPSQVIGASVVALFLGIVINYFSDKPKVFDAGITFTAKKILRLAIVLLGTSLSIGTILNVGRLSLAVMFFTLLTCFGGGYFIGRALGLDWKLSNLISAGTGICGGSAIAALAPVIEAKDSDVAYAMSATFIFDMAMIVLFPLMGQALNMSDMAFGLWAGTAINDTSSVVAAGYTYSEVAGDFATMVKLTRTLVIIPTVLVFSWIQFKAKTAQNGIAGEKKERKKVSITSLIPWFIIFFVVMAILNSSGLIPPAVSDSLKTLSRFLMVMALGAIGLKTDLSEMKQSGINPMVHGFIISALVVIVALGVEYAMGIV